MDKSPFDGRRQREALTTLQKESGRDATAVARDVCLSYPQYNRYLWGRVPLRTDQLRVFAAAYGVSPSRLVDALGLAEDAPSPAETLRETLRGEMPESDLDVLEARYGGEHPLDQAARAEHARRAVADQRDATRSHRQNRPA